MDTAEVRPGATTPAPPAAERVYAEVKAAILDRSLPGGHLLTEGEVAERVGVSRTPVREGLLRLQAEGLVHLIPKRGALVVPVSPAEVEDVLEARELVEVHTAARAWELRAELTAPLAAHLADMRTARAAGDGWAFTAADRAFHATLVRAAGNAILSGLYDSLRDRQMRMGVAIVGGSRERMGTTLEQHAALLEALGGTDRQRWLDLVREHVRTAGQRLRSAR